jgi:hypothetical protein
MDLRAHLALSLVCLEVELDRVAGLQAIGEPVLAPLAVFLRAQLDCGVVRLVLDVEVPVLVLFRVGRACGEHADCQRRSDYRCRNRGVHTRHLPFPHFTS